AIRPCDSTAWAMRSHRSPTSAPAPHAVCCAGVAPTEKAAWRLCSITDKAETAPGYAPNRSKPCKTNCIATRPPNPWDPMPAPDPPATVILAADEACLYLQASLMRVGAPTGQTPVVRADAGRDNTHFYGALNLASGQEVVLRSDLMNAAASALFLSVLLQAYP